MEYAILINIFPTFLPLNSDFLSRPPFLQRLHRTLQPDLQMLNTFLLVLPHRNGTGSKSPHIYREISMALNKKPDALSELIMGRALI